MEISLPSSAPRRSRASVALALVALAHVLALFFVLRANTPAPTQADNVRIVSAVLLSPEPSAPAPAPPAPIEPPKPRPVAKPVPKAAPKVVKRPTPLPLPTPAPAVETAPSVPAPAAESTPAPPSEPAKVSAPSAAPQIADNTPRDVQHLTCTSTPPDYPVMSRRNNETGTTVIEIVVGTRGQVETATVKTSSGYPRLDEAARRAALDSPCTPYMVGSAPVRARANRPYRFSLND